LSSDLEHMGIGTTKMSKADKSRLLRHFQLKPEEECTKVAPKQGEVVQ